jgi:hypothetical protein
MAGVINHRLGASPKMHAPDNFYVIHAEWFKPKQTTFAPVDGTTNCLQITHHGKKCLINWHFKVKTNL